MKVLKALGRVFWTIVLVVLLVGGVFCTIAITPALSLVATISVPLVGETTMTAIVNAPAFLGVFGGTSDQFTMITFVEGVEEGIESGPFSQTLNFDYGTFIALLVGLAGALLVIICWRHKNLCLIGSLVSLVGTVLVSLQGVFFQAVNEAFINESANVGDLISMEFTSVAVPIGGIICAICFGLIFLVGLIHGIVEKAHK